MYQVFDPRNGSAFAYVFSEKKAKQLSNYLGFDYAKHNPFMVLVMTFHYLTPFGHSDFNNFRSWRF